MRLDRLQGFLDAYARFKALDEHTFELNERAYDYELRDNYNVPFLVIKDSEADRAYRALVEQKVALQKQIHAEYGVFVSDLRLVGSTLTKLVGE